MHETWNHILAEGSDEIFGVIAMLVLFALSAIGSGIQNARKKRQEQEAHQRRQVEEGQPQPPVPVAPPPIVVKESRQSPFQHASTPREIARRQQEVLRLQHKAEQNRHMRVAQAAEDRRQVTRQAAQTAQRQVQDVEQAQEDVRRATQLSSGTSHPLPVIDLHSQEALRKAILLHEIFSAPKALREEKEMWEA